MKKRRRKRVGKVGEARKMNETDEINGKEEGPWLTPGEKKGNPCEKRKKREKEKGKKGVGVDKGK